MPALRDRREDIPLLASEFLRRFDEEHHTEHQLTQSAFRVLENCYFPGNVRELENCIRRTATLAHDERISDDDFACQHDECLSATLWKTAVSPPFPIVQPRLSEAVAVAPPAPVQPGVSEEVALAPAPARREAPLDNVKISRMELIEALEAAGWVQAKAARMLKLTPRQIGYAIRKYGIEVKRL